MTDVSFVLLRMKAGNTMVAWRPFLGVEGISSLTRVGRRIHRITGQMDLPGKEMSYAYDVKKCFQTHEPSLNPRLRTIKETQVRAEKKPKESSSWCCPSRWSSLSVTVVLRQAHEKGGSKGVTTSSGITPIAGGKQKQGQSYPEPSSLSFSNLSWPKQLGLTKSCR